MFELLSTSPMGRRGRIHTMHGVIETPVFFPVGTAGAMRGMTLDDVRGLGSQVLLCNTYHLHIQPGENTIAEAGGLHEFIGWDGPILTDSGGFQVFSLEGNRKIVEHGVHFKSHIDGSPLFLGPEEAMRIQHTLGSDIIMCFDECPPSTAPRKKQIEAVDRTLRWAKECKKWHEQLKAETGPRPSKTSVTSPLLFGIIQGGLERDLREKCAQELIAIGFDGYAIGGLAVGETEKEMYDVLEYVCPILPKDKPRYLMGVGRISQHKEAVKHGIDLFDCVMPMREARHGKIYLSDGTHINIRNSAFTHDHSIIDSTSTSALSRKHLKSYLSHLFRLNERSAQTIACMQNMAVTLEAMKTLREEIESL
ncbi:tRNA guanosine(34) transglycosylase Tgt [Candidatus Peribacteria bacterium]|nr:MAG: tRNA guanosine(34) transglycosylase Tgt [Candidatus Peribacteria bacterium]